MLFIKELYNLEAAFIYIKMYVALLEIWRN